MTDQPKLTTNRPGGGPRTSPIQYALPIALGLAVGSALYAGYQYWTHRTTEQHALTAAPGDPDLAKPATGECAIARTALTAFHASGADKAWVKGSGASGITLSSDSKVVNPADIAGYSDDEAENLRGKAAADWRWCPGLGAFIAGLGWRPMGGDEAVGELALGRPAMNRSGDEAKVYEVFLAPDADTGALRLAQGPWLATLLRGADGAWRVASSETLKTPRP